MIVFNVLGAGIGFLAMLLTAVIVNKIAPGTSIWDWQSLMSLSVFTMAPDLALRLRRRRQEGWNTLRMLSTGGHVFFIPMWIWGVIAAIVAMLTFAGVMRLT